jgi:RNA-binding motif X-linked protein 2
MNQTRNIQKLNEYELKNNTKTSWHDDYKDSAYIYIGGLPYELTEGDIISMFSQYGEIMDLDVKKDKEGKSMGFAYLGYEDQRSTVLAVDNFNGIKILDRTIRVDHTRYKVKEEDLEKQRERIRLIYPHSKG